MNRWSVLSLFQIVGGTHRNSHIKLTNSEIAPTTNSNSVFVAALKLVEGNETANGFGAGNGDRLVGKKALDCICQIVIVRGRPFLAEARVQVVDGSPIDWR